MKKATWLIRSLFLVLFMAFAYYILFVETEKYESKSITALKDLSKKQEVNLGSILSGNNDPIATDSNVLELYIRSCEMYDFLDKKYQLSDYYTSKTMDFYQRLYKDALLPAYRVSRETLLAAYNKDLFVTYEGLSQTLTLKFAHADSNVSQAILKDIIAHSDDVINTFSRENAKISLAFIRKQVKENRELFIKSIKNLIHYQNKHHTLDPHLDAARKNTILAELEADLAKKEVEYTSKLKSNWNPNGSEMRMIRATINNTKKSIESMMKELSGNSKQSSELNVNIFDFEVLKNEMEFAKEVYKQTLINQEKVKIEVNQNAKHLVVITKPNKAESYTYPDKVWDIFTLALTLFFLYGIFMTIIIIVRDHKD
jgi:capsular polysaccharide transport system permease protein